MDQKRTASLTWMPAFGLGVGLLVIWQLVATFQLVDRLLLPSPLAVLYSTWNNLGMLLFHAGVTLAECLGGLLIGVLSGASLALLSCYFPLLGRMVMPFCVSLKSTPLIVLAPLLVIWLGNGYFSKVSMAAISSFFAVYVSALSGLTSIEQEWLDLMQLHKSSRFQCLVLLRIPIALPEFFTGCRIASSLALVGAVVAEFTGAENGIGHLITNATYYLNMDIVFSGVALLCMQGLVIYWLFSLLQRKIVFWKSER